MAFVRAFVPATALMLVAAALTVAAAQGAAGTGSVAAESRASFAWGAPGLPAVIEIPLPEGVGIEEIERVSAATEMTLLGFSVTGDPATLLLYLEAPDGSAGRRHLEVVELIGASGVRSELMVGPTTVVSADPMEGPLRFERSLAAPEGGLFLAVVLRNDSDQNLQLTGVEYLPEPLRPGRLLLASTANIGRTLALLEDQFSPANLREAERTGVEIGTSLTEGDFGWVDPNGDAPMGGMEIGPGDAAVIVWTPAAFGKGSEPRSFVLRPVIRYSASLGGEERRLGVPTAVSGAP